MTLPELKKIKIILEILTIQFLALEWLKEIYSDILIDGYTIDFYLESLKEAGFKIANVYWQGGLRIVYGGTK